jgi:hypothetical protein
LALIGKPSAADFADERVIGTDSIAPAAAKVGICGLEFDSHSFAQIRGRFCIVDVELRNHRSLLKLFFYHALICEISGNLLLR